MRELSSNPRRTPGVLIVGTGLIGASIGQALCAADVPVWLRDVSPDVERTASLLGAGRQWDATAQDPEAVGCVVVAVPPSRIATVSADALRAHAAATVVHVGSIQSEPLHELRALMGDTDRFIGTHPMAGRERGGPASASPHLFQDRPWVICPDGASAAALAAARWLAESCGAVVTEMSAAQHDAAVAIVSHVPQLVSSAVAASLADVDEPVVAVAGTGIRDVTRLAAAEPAMWSDIVAANAAPVRAGLERVVATLQDTLLRLTEEPAAAVAELVRAGAEGRARLSGKHGGRPRHWGSVSVVVPDRPGALVEALTVASECQVNVEDLRVEHGAGHPLGILEMLVEPNSTRTLSSALTAAGWDVAGVVTPHD